MTLIQKRSETLSMIAEAVCRSAGITVKELIGNYQGRKHSSARKVFSILSKMYGIRVVDAAEFLKYGHHSSIITNQQQFFLLFMEDEELQVIFISAINALKGKKIV